MPEPEVVLVINRRGRIVGWTEGAKCPGGRQKARTPCLCRRPRSIPARARWVRGIEIAADGHVPELEIVLTVRREGRVVVARKRHDGRYDAHVR